MKNRNPIVPVLGLFLLFVALVVIIWLVQGSMDKADAAEKFGGVEKERTTGLMEWEGTGPMSLGKYIGQVDYDEKDGLYYLQLRGARFPFKTSPIQAQQMKLDAKGKNALEKNTSLLYGILGPDVSYVTLLVNPDEEDLVMPAAADLTRYVQIVNPEKFAGVAYTKSGGKRENSVTMGSQIQAIDSATSTNPIILLKGPGSGAQDTGVWVADDGKIVVEGKTYEELYEAADFICITLLKMLCGSSECPDASACATGGGCGCG